MAGKTTADIIKLAWPAVIYSDNHDELLYLAGPDSWQAYVHQPGPGGSMHDALVDSAGHRYALGEIDGRLSVLARDDDATLDEMTGRLRRYAALNGQCCITKIFVQDMPQAIEMVRSIDE